MKISKKEIEELNKEIEILTNSADGGNSESQYNLGYKYLSGIRGIKKNRDLGVKYMKMAKNQDHEGAKKFIYNQLIKASKKYRDVWNDY